MIVPKHVVVIKSSLVKEFTGKYNVFPISLENFLLMGMNKYNVLIFLEENEKEKQKREVSLILQNSLFDNFELESNKNEDPNMLEIPKNLLNKEMKVFVMEIKEYKKNFPFSPEYLIFSDVILKETKLVCLARKRMKY
ncbi:MAG: hypothetical protein QXT71_06235 [Thermoplasmata archaeon]